MREKTLGFLMLLAFFLLAPLHISNAYLRCSQFDNIRVQHSDSVWSIARRYAPNDEQACSLQDAIIEINGLDADGSLRDGQILRIPLKKADRAFRLAER